jgi:hypothetical protein
MALCAWYILSSAKLWVPIVVACRRSIFGPHEELNTVIRETEGNGRDGLISVQEIRNWCFEDLFWSRLHKQTLACGDGDRLRSRL